jgi:hypothetical protein
VTPEIFDSAVEQAKATSPIVRLALLEARERPASSDDVEMFEARHRLVLPRAYRYFATTYGCGQFVFTTVLSPLADSEWCIDGHRRRVGPDLLPIIDNGCGDYYCFRVRGGRCDDDVVFADHEQGYQASEGNAGFFELLVERGLRA